MRGGGGVDSAIHRGAGPGLIQECRERLPHRLATRPAAGTPGHDLPARWVIHVVGPNRNAGETDRGLLVSCYTNALAVADELGVDSLAVPLVSAGVYGWPLEDAIAACVDTLSGTPTRVRAAVVVAFGQATYEAVVR